MLCVIVGQEIVKMSTNAKRTGSAPPKHKAPENMFVQEKDMLEFSSGVVRDYHAETVVSTC